MMTSRYTIEMLGVEVKHENDRGDEQRPYGCQHAIEQVLEPAMSFPPLQWQNRCNSIHMQSDLSSPMQPCAQGKDCEHKAPCLRPVLVPAAFPY